jgi:hypothetical protein
MKHITDFEKFLNESSESGWHYGTMPNGGIEIATLRFREATDIVKKLTDAGFDAQALQSRGMYYDGFIHINPPNTHDEIVAMAKIIEDHLESPLINQDGKRPAQTGKI